VLVVDDDSNIRRMIVAALKRDGYAFLEAPNGREALDLMRSDHPDVVVLDLMMPILSGWDVLAERQQDADLMRIPVILISANRDPEIASAVDKGICAFFCRSRSISGRCRRWSAAACRRNRRKNDRGGLRRAGTAGAVCFRA